MTETKFVERRKPILLQLLAAGASRSHAAAAAGVSRSTFYVWMRQGEKGHPEGHWARFRREVLAAEAAAPTLGALPTEDEVRWAVSLLDHLGWDGQ
jgi:transposase